MPLPRKAQLGLVFALMVVGSNQASHQELSLSCFKRALELFCTKFYSDYLSSCRRTVNQQNLVMLQPHNAICYQSAMDQCISGHVCQDQFNPKLEVMFYRANVVWT